MLSRHRLWGHGPNAVVDDTGVRPMRRRRLPLLLLVLGIACILLGIGLLAGPLYGVWHREQADQGALSTWQKGGSASIAGPAHQSAAPVPVTCGSGTGADYALLRFNAPAAYHYAGVAGDGDWNLLHDRSMVHYHGTPDPGQPGNVIIAFHREPNYEHIEDLGVGGTVAVQDRACHSFTYTVTGRWILDPEQVTQLVPTSGHDLTLITCTPWWQDTQRLVWRATLVP